MNQSRANWKKRNGDDPERDPERAPEAGQQPVRIAHIAV